MDDVTYEYYIWDLRETSQEALKEKIEKALRDAGLAFEYKNFEYN